MKEMLGTIIRIITCIVVVLFVTFVVKHTNIMFAIPATVIAYIAWVLLLIFLESKEL